MGEIGRYSQRSRRPVALFALAIGLGGYGCGGDGSANVGRNDAGTSDDADAATVRHDAGVTIDSGAPAPEAEAELWYSVDDLLVHIAVNEDDGSIAAIHVSHSTIELELGQDAITMLDDGSLLLARLNKDDFQTYFYYIADPPRDGSDVTPAMIGVMPDDIMIEGLYTDCDGRVYAMDTGEDDGSSTGNRLLRFTGDVLSGDFTFHVVSDLGSAVVADIDDMSPGIDNNTITDNPGLAIDTGNIYDFNYETGTGTMVATGGTWGMHALGGDLFNDGTSRLYIMSRDAELFSVNPDTFELSDVLETGPTPDEGTPGWSGLAGPLTACDTGFDPE